MKQIKKMMQGACWMLKQEDPFTLFVASTNIRYCYYADSHKILGNTFGMCVLQVNSMLFQLLGRKAVTGHADVQGCQHRRRMCTGL